MKQNNRSKGIVYNLYRGIHARCYNPKSINYSYYGEKGIKICDEWLDYFVFEKWMIENGYTKELSIERKDNTKDYSPENCKLIPKVEQPINRGKFSNTKNNSTGVYYRKELTTNPYRAELTIDKKTHVIGYFETEELAIIARQEFKNNPPTKK